MPGYREVFRSNHFVVEQLEEGIYAVIQRQGGWAVANSGIIDLGEISLVFDTFLTVQAATDLKLATEQLTGNPVGIVINSHYHNDHIWGNQVFDSQAHIISSDETLNLIKIDGKEEYNLYKESAESRLDELRTKYENEEDDDQITNLSTWISYYEGLVATLPILSVRHPNMTFKDRMKIHGPNFGIDLIAYQGGHTGSDTILHMPSKGILFMGDLLFVGTHPYLSDGNPDNLLTIFEEIGNFEPEILVPGHGPVGKNEDLNLMKEYILHCDQTGRQLAETGKIDTGISDHPIPDEFSNWILPNFYPINLLYYYDQYRSRADSDDIES
jgi:glyoxylase-like metal-dependent hydrolase (beta-lactamase superfamily II)